MPNYLSELLQFPGTPEQDQNGVDLRSLLEQPAPMMPPMRKFAPMQVPQRPRPEWTELIPQILAGAGDVMTARARGRSDYLGRVMGGQEGRRNQAWNDAMMQTQINQQSQNADYEDQWRRYVGEQTAQDRKFGRASKVAEFDLMKSAIEKQKAEAEKQSNFQKFMYEQAAGQKLKDVAGAGELEDVMKQATLQVRSPEELQVLLELGKKKKAEFDDKAAMEKEIQAETQRIMKEKFGNLPMNLGQGWYSAYQTARQMAEQAIMQRRSGAAPK